MYKSFATIVILLVVLITLSGCVSPEKYVLREEFDALQQELNELDSVYQSVMQDYEEQVQTNEDLVEELSAKQTELDEKEAALAAVESELADVLSDLVQTRKENSELNTSLQTTEQENYYLQERITDLENQLIGTTEIPEIQLLSSEVNTYETWRTSLSDKFYMLLGYGNRRVLAMLPWLGYSTGVLGGDTDYTYAHIGNYWGTISNSNTIIIYDPSSEPWTALASWPELYNSVFSFSVSDLQQQLVPFALLEKDNARGVIRSIIVANSEADFILLLSAMLGNDVPIGVPWSAK